MLHRARLQTEALINELPAPRPFGSLKHKTYREKLQNKNREYSIKFANLFGKKSG